MLVLICGIVLFVVDLERHLQKCEQIMFVIRLLLKINAYLIENKSCVYSSAGLKG